jgi:hypothetical protein
MKTVFLFCAALVAVAPARAQIFRPVAVNNAILGGVIGAVIGNNSGSLHHNAWQGAAIGAGAGLLLSASAGDASHGGTYLYRDEPRAYGYPAYHQPYYPGYRYYDYYGRPDYRGPGVFFGGVAGAIIGNNSRGFHHDAWRGAAWGAGIGYLLGSVAESNARYYERVNESLPVYVQPTVTTPAAPAQNITIINNYYSTPATPMSAANDLFGRN